jgi:hypothetical protein
MRGDHALVVQNAHLVEGSEHGDGATTWSCETE